MTDFYAAPSESPTATGAATGGGVQVSTTFDIPGTRITRYCGSTFGVVVRSMGFAKGIGAAFRTIAGGEVTQYTQLLEDSRRHAMDRMIENARLLGGNAVIGMRFDSSEIGESLTEIVAYGTA
ncbi:MAG TPA: YbjQ family protein, partial [Mycobacteriales bacterium]|nr:YbjQ family protein [Mycobacteriales bacterium]